MHSNVCRRRTATGSSGTGLGSGAVGRYLYRVPEPSRIALEIVAPAALVCVRHSAYAGGQ
jgi:hypothetical protein